MTVDSSQPIPLYIQLKTVLLEEILGGVYGRDGRLPTEHELCRSYRISRTPVSRALSELAEEGVILRHRRRGTFVNPHWLRRRADQREVRVVVPEEGPWARMIREARAAGHRGRRRHGCLDPTSTRRSRMRSPRARRPTWPCSTRSGPPSSRRPAFSMRSKISTSEWVRDEHEMDFLDALVAANTVRRPDVRRLRVRRRRGVLVPPARAGGSRALEPPSTWAELRAVARALVASGDAHPDRDAGRLAGRRDDRVLPDLLPRVEQRGGADTPRGSACTRARPPRCCASCASLVDDGLMSPDVVAYEWDRPIRLLAEGEAAISFGGSYEAAALAATLGVPLRELWDHVGFAPIPGGPRGAPGERRRDDGLRHLPAGRAAGAWRCACSRTSSRRRRSRGSPAQRAGFRPARSAVALAAPGLAFLSQTADAARSCGHRPVNAALPARLGPAPGDARGRAHRPARSSRGGSAHAAELIGAITGLPVLDDADPPRASAGAGILAVGAR